MSKRKFLLVAPTSFNLYRLIVKNLEYLGYEVIHIEEGGYPFSYSSLGERLYNLFRKTVFNDRLYKEMLKEAYTYRKQQEILDKYNFFDVSLVIRADLFRKSFIEIIRQKTSQMISYHFDGISRNPNILHYIFLFDRFYVFDKEDVQKYSSYNLLYSPNFYFDYPDLLDKNSNSYYDIYYVSTFHQSRVDDLIRMHQYLSNYYERIKFVVVCNKVKETLLPDYVIEHMDVRYEYVSFSEQLNYIAHVDAIIDLVIAEHSGYSFRVIEGMQFEKKVITTNPKVTEAEFYHPDNFFILTKENYKDLGAFLKRKYCPIDADIRRKYSFSEWLSDKLQE